MLAKRGQNSSVTELPASSRGPRERALALAALEGGVRLSSSCIKGAATSRNNYYSRAHDCSTGDYTSLEEWRAVH